ncbi:MAG: cyclase family protein [Methanobacteriaceae archaeon]|nr:cyclase family protein [Methanobacteriaceae archaeon]
MTYITLSYHLENDSPVHKGLVQPQILPKSQITDGEYYNSYLIHVENHSGTHVDAPGHFLNEGKKIGDYYPEELIYHNPLILDCPKMDNELVTIPDLENIELSGVDCLFFKTGFGKYRASNRERYLTQNPGVSPELVGWIRKEYPKIRGLGIDAISLSRFQNVKSGIEAHLNAFNKEEYGGPPLLLIEDLNLTVLENPHQVKKIILVPWQLKEVDSAPCTVLARI